MIEDTTPGQLDAIHQRLNTGDARMGRIEESLAANTAATTANAKTLSELQPSIATLAEWLAAFEGAFKVLNGLGKLAKPLGYIATLGAAIASTWYAFKSGGGIGPK